jgi:hypothetical protein
VHLYFHFKVRDEKIVYVYDECLLNAKQTPAWFSE